MKTILILLVATLPLNAGKIEDERLRRQEEFKRRIEQGQREFEHWQAMREARRIAEENRVVWERIAREKADRDFYMQRELGEIRKELERNRFELERPFRR